MYSREGHHIRAYKAWSGFEGKPVSTIDHQGKEKMVMVPTLIENLKFFFNYQVGYMYFRYFLWNFSGRQNDIQGHGEIHKGNWITGIPIIDQARYGDTSLLPKEYSENKGHNKYYMSYNFV